MLVIISEKISHKRLNELCQAHFKSFIKIVVDVHLEILSAGGELHADGETLLLSQGSMQKHLWGANFYPSKSYNERLEFTALINIRPSQNNVDMEVTDPQIRRKILAITESLLISRDEVFLPE